MNCDAVIANLLKTNSSSKHRWKRRQKNVGHKLLRANPSVANAVMVDLIKRLLFNWVKLAFMDACLLLCCVIRNLEMCMYAWQWIIVGDALYFLLRSEMLLKHVFHQGTIYLYKSRQALSLRA